MLVACAGLSAGEVASCDRYRVWGGGGRRAWNVMWPPRPLAAFGVQRQARLGSIAVVGPPPLV